MKKISSYLLVLLVQIAFGLIILEFVCYLYFHQTPNALHRARIIMHVDQQLGWRIKENLKTQFEKKKDLNQNVDFEHRNLL